MAKNEIPKISDFQSLGLCDGFAKVWKEWVTRTQTRDDTGRITLWLLLLDLDSESGSWVTASSVPSRSSPLPHSPVLSMEISLVCPGPCVQHQSWGANIYLYNVPWLRRNYPVMLMQHSSRGFVLLLLPAGFTWLHCFPRSILSLLLTTLHLDCLYLPRSTAAMISDWCT